MHFHQYFTKTSARNVEQIVAPIIKALDAAHVPVTGKAEALSALSYALYDEFLLANLNMIEIRRLTNRKQNKHIYRLSIKFHIENRAYRLFIRYHVDGTFYSQVYIPSKRFILDNPNTQYSDIVEYFEMFKQGKALVVDKCSNERLSEYIKV